MKFRKTRKNIRRKNIQIGGCSKYDKDITSTQCDNNQIFSFIKEECVSRNSYYGMIQELRNLHFSQNSLFDDDNNNIPIQKNNNCWFNTFIIAVFLSDKGREYSKYLRYLMIRGIDYKKNPLEKEFKIAMKELNTLIDTKFIGDGANVITKLNKSGYDTKLGGFSDPADTLNYIVDKFNWNNKQPYYTVVLPELGNVNNNDELIMLQLQPISNEVNTIMLEISFNDNTYVLDCIMIFGYVKRNHWACAFTYNGEEYFHDGFSTPHITKINWSSMLDKNEDITTNSGYKFNFKKSPCYCFYYKK
jgi:hypothetical protein